MTNCLQIVLVYVQSKREKTYRGMARLLNVVTSAIDASTSTALDKETSLSRMCAYIQSVKHQETYENPT